MALKIYGVALSRAGRTLWLAEELGLPYEHVKTTFTGGTRTPEYLKINPNGRIPAIDEDGFTLWESMAINLYLAKKHGAGNGKFRRMDANVTIRIVIGSNPARGGGGRAARRAPAPKDPDDDHAAAAARA